MLKYSVLGLICKAITVPSYGDTLQNSHTEFPGCILQAGFGLSLSPGLRGRVAGQDVILPIL